MNDEMFKAQARVLNALANPVRLRIIEELRDGERCLCELQPLFPLNKSTLSRHVAALTRIGIVGSRRAGVRAYLRLCTPCILEMFACVTRVIRPAVRRRRKATRHAAAKRSRP